MSISLNYVNNEVVRAHRRIDELTSKVSDTILIDNELNGVNSLKFKLGKIRIGTDSRARVSFARPFPNTCLIAFLQATGNRNVGNGTLYADPQVNGCDKTGFEISNDSFQTTFYWLAIGYLISNRKLKSIYEKVIQLSTNVIHLVINNVIYYLIPKISGDVK